MIRIKLLDEKMNIVERPELPDYEGQLPKCIILDGKFYFYSHFEYEKGMPVSIYVIGEAIVVKKKIDGEVGDKDAQSKECPDSLFDNHPRTLEEASEDFLVYFSTAKDFNEMMSMQEDDFIYACHHVSGAWLRNTYYLWWYPDHACKDWPKHIPPLVTYFNNIGITHADDMSSMILRTAYRKHYNRPILEHEQVAYYQKHWKENGFPDGIFRRS